MLREFTARVGKKPKTVLPKVGKDLPTAVYHRLAEHGLVSRQERRAMWVFPQVSWPVVAGAQAAVAASVTVIAAVGAASS